MQDLPQVKQQQQNTTTMDIQNLILCCQFGNPAHFFCVSKVCTQNKILCGELECECQKDQHDDCSFTKSAVLLTKLINKKNCILQNPDIKFILKKVQETYDKLLGIISQSRQKLIKDIQNCGMIQQEIMLLDRIIEKRVDKIDGRILSKVIANIDTPLDKFLLNVKDQKMKSFIEEQETKLRQFTQNFEHSYISKVTRINSYIIISELQYKKLINMFKDKVVSMQLLYRASQNNFSAKNFHQKCDDIKDTVVLIKTQGKQIIGGFSPQCWDQSDKYKYNQRTFVFSLSQNARYSCVSKNKTTYCFSNHGPCFGGKKQLLKNGQFEKLHDIFIPDGDEQGQFYIGTAFNNGSVNSSNTKEKRILFCGSIKQAPQAKIRQWQVFKVNFIQDREESVRSQSYQSSDY